MPTKEHQFQYCLLISNLDARHKIKILQLIYKVIANYKILQSFSEMFASQKEIPRFSLIFGVLNRKNKFRINFFHKKFLPLDKENK